MLDVRRCSLMATGASVPQKATFWTAASATKMSRTMKIASILDLLSTNKKSPVKPEGSTGDAPLLELPVDHRGKALEGQRYDREKNDPLNHSSNS